MSISNDLVKQFVQITKDNSPVKTESTVYGTTVEYDGQMYVQIDGSDLITPVETTTELKSGERVTVMIKDHNATVTGNLTNPAAGKNTVANIQGNLDDIGSQITEFEIVIADKVSTKDFEANNAAINNLLVGKADINELNAVSASVRDLEAENANIQTLISNKANIADLTAANAKIDDLYANKANVGDLEAATADINDLNADVAKISTLIGGDANIDNVQSIILTSDNTTIDNALIKNAMIDTISADKITSGTVNTNKVNIVSEDGGIVIAGSTQQFKDETGTVRVQIGKDAQGNFTFCLFSQNGTGVLLDETGIKAGAVPDGLIVNDMVADNANISGTKLDISSVITQINGSSTSINSSVIKFDDTGQSLLVAFNSLKETVSSIEELTIDGDLAGVMEQVKTNTTKLEVVQGSIETLVTNTTITKENGEVVQLKDDYAVTKQTVGEITNKIGTLETNYKKTLKSSSVQYYLSTSLTSLSGGSWQDTAPEWTQGKYMWQRMKYTYTDNSVTYGTASCVAGAKGDTGEQGPQGSKGDTGDSGVGVSKITNYYLAINSATGVTNTMTGWTTTIQNVSKDKKYLWNYEKVDYTNNTSTKTDPCIIGTYGDTGATGKGIQLITEYYATSTTKESLPTSWSTTVPTLTATNKYLWNYEKITYTDNSNVDTPKVIIGVYGDKGDTGAQGPKGDKGDIGPQGVQGPAGKDGKAYYTWIKYADSSTGSGMSNDPTGKSYIGLAHNKTTSTESNTASDYTWSLIKGEKGDTGVQGPAGSNGKTTYTWIKYSDNADGTGLYDTPKSTTKYIGIATNKTTATESTTKTDYTWSLFKGDKGDTGSQGPKGDKGDTGPQGVQGPAGKDGKTYYTWIKYADSSTGSGMSNDPTGKSYIGFAYNKTTPTESNTASDYTWSLIKGDKGDTGVQGPAGKNGTTTYTWIKYSDNADGTGLYDTPKSTTKYIGIATNKTTATESTTKTDYTWSLFKGDKGDKGSQGPKGDTGSKGDTGEKGQSLTSSSPQWYLSTSNTTQTGGSWKDTMPTVVSGKYMWTRFKNVWANPTATTYTTPVLEQIAESVKEVHSKQAEFKETLDGISATVSEHTSSLESVTSTVSQHTTDLTGISSKITSLEKNTSGLSKTVAQHTTDLSGVTSKISSLESSASGLNSRLQTAENKLTKDGITSIVGDYYAAGKATRDALSRIEQKADSVTTTVSNLKVGGTNLLLNTQFEGAVAGTRTLPYWLITESCIIYGNYGQSGYNKMNTMYLGNDNANSDGTKTGYMYQTLTSDRFQKNTEYTLSLELVAENNVKGWEVVIRYYDTNSKLLANQVIFDNSTHSAGHLVSTFTSKNIDANMVQFCIGHKGSTNGNSGYLLIVGNIMLEKGNTPTQWQPSPQDMASKSIVTQTANEVKYQFQQAGGFPNLVANGAPKQTNDNNWWYWNATKYTGDNNYTELGFYSNKTSDNNCCIGTQWMVVSPGKTYSISFWAYCEPNVVNPYVIAKCGDSNFENLQYPRLCNLKLGNANDKKWYKYKINWTAPSGITRMQLCFHQENHTQTQNYVTRIDQVMVIEGKDIFPTKWYPRFEEVESNTTSIDVNGVNVRHSSGARTNLNSRALNFYNPSGILYAQVDGGKYHFWNDSTYVGFLGHTSWVNTNERVLTINADYNQTVALTGKVNSSDSSYQVWVVASPLDKTISGSVFHQGVTLIKPHTGGIFKFYGSSAHTDTYPGMIYATTEGYLCVKGDNHVELAIQVGNTGYNGLVITEIGENPYKKLDIWGRLDMHWWEIYNTNIVNNVSATSAQTYALRTSSTNEETYSDPTRKTITNIFPVQSPTEGDIRWSDRQTYFTSEVETGVYECYVEIPWWIAQNLENDYHVNITCTNGFFQYYVSERDPYYFIVRSDKDSMGFTFELCGKLLDNNTTANNASVAGDQYLGHEIREDEEPLIVKDDGGSILENNTDTVINN